MSASVDVADNISMLPINVRVTSQVDEAQFHKATLVFGINKFE